MEKKRLIISLSIFGSVLLLSFLIMVFSMKNEYDYKNNSWMFESIEDLAFIDEYIIEENINLDSNINSYEKYILDNKTVLINYKGNKINIFAYVFSNTDYCVEYARKVSGNKYVDVTCNYYYKNVSFLNIIQSEKLLIFCDNKAYVINAKINDKDFREFIKYFMEELPVKLEIPD